MMKPSLLPILVLSCVGLACAEYPVDLPRSQPWEFEEEEGDDIYLCRTPEATDFLFVIDNAGRSCPFQKYLRHNLSEMVDGLLDTGTDLQFGVLTGHAEETGVIDAEPVARRGHLQDRAQPLPGFSMECYHEQPAHGDFRRLQEQLQIAVECAAEPAQWEHLLDLNRQDLRCLLPQHTINSEGCNPGQATTVEQLLPSPEQMRVIGPVIAIEDYEGPGGLDRSALLDDLRCLTAVGSRGFGIQKPIEAVEIALSPAFSSAEHAPNYGFIRPLASTAITFFSVKGDCSHDGTLDERTSCGDLPCYAGDGDGAPGPPLIDVDELMPRFAANLAQLRGVDLDEVIHQTRVVSFHGATHRRPVPDDCSAGYQSPVACHSSAGPVFSGDQLARFAQWFPRGYGPEDEEALLCGDPSLELTRLATLLGFCTAGIEDG